MARVQPPKSGRRRIPSAGFSPRPSRLLRPRLYGKARPSRLLRLLRAVSVSTARLGSVIYDMAICSSLRVVAVLY